ncbi:MULTISPECIES: rhodanese-like domain-containing protein [Shewanella]|uniref:Rhodanese-like domain-containing protein n=1 Tax=Shewanella polaris TaxID=2588449 RepID=A0A4Y5YK51_9GAMM|nr:MULTISPECIES: rhodanese-like domain-containing protein [Shewanella]QDE33180.1 rhodanese-like domain-containing protein [Shewanella polaris]
MLAVSFISPAQVVEQDPNVAWQKIDKGDMVIDVRTAEEFAAGHINGAINIPFDQIVPQLAKLNLAKDTDVVLYCRSGRRSGMAQNALVKQGYSKTYNAGGLDTLMSSR